MVTHTHRIPEALALYFRKIGGGNESEGLRIVGEEHKRDFKEQRHGAADRRASNKKTRR